MIKLIQAKLRDTTIKNIISNYFAYGITGVFSILIIPYYLRLFGINEWGIIALATSVQAILTIFDLGLAQVMPSYISRSTNLEEKYKAYRIFSKIYLIVGSIAFLFAQLFVNKYIDNWIIINESKKSIVEIVIRMSIVQFFFQYLNGVNVGYWYGTQRITLINKRLIIFFFAKHISAIILIKYCGAHPIYYLLPFVLFTLFDYMSALYLLRIEGAEFKKLKINFDDYKGILKNNVGLCIAITFGLIVTQVDKLVLTKNIPVNKYGIYTLTYAMAMGILQLYLPVINALLPKVVESERDNHYDSGISFVLKYFHLFTIIPLILLIIFSKNLLFLWTHNSQIAQEGEMSLRLLLTYVLFNIAVSINYLKFLAKNSFKKILIINAAALLACCLLILIFNKSLGIMLGGAFWITYGVIQFFGFVFLKEKQSKTLTI
ncbi:MAG: oligosaccharide flippase family protein [Lutibacter sp.]|nr:oligosaccharide flippase family protein [Lutibacter sp.]